MTFISKRILLSGVAAVAIGVGALVPFQAQEADAMSRGCFQAFIGRGQALALFDGGLGDSMWAHETIAWDDWINANC